MTLAANKTQNQNMAPAPVGGGKMGAFRQRTTESITYEIDYSRWLAEDTKILNANWSVAPSEIDKPDIVEFLIQDERIFLRIEGGKEGHKYVFTLDVETSDNQEKEDWFTIRFGVDGDEAAIPYAETALSKIQSIADAVKNNAQAAAASAALAATDATIVGNIKTETERVRDAAKEAEAGSKDAAKESAHQSILSHDYAEVSYAFAEHMPDEIPHHFLHRINLEGTYHSSRWWSERAAGLGTRLMELYLGVFDTPPTAGMDGGIIPPGAIYFDTTSNKPFIWTGTDWRVFWAPEKASTATLYYLAAVGQTTFPIATRDLFGNDYVFDAADPEAVEVYLNGVRLLPSYGPDGSLGDYTVSYDLNEVGFSQPLLENTVVTIDILTPRSKLAPGAVTIMPLWDIDVDPGNMVAGEVNGVRTDFTLYLADGVTPVNVSKPEEIFISVDGVVQNPGVDYDASGSTLTFTRAPMPEAKVWAMWFKPGGATGTSGAGVLPPANPDDRHINSYFWDPKILGGKGGEWRDSRGDVHSVANAAARLALNDPAEIIPGSLVFERDTKNLWVYTPAGAAAPTGSAGAAGGTGATGTGGTTVRQDITLPTGANFQAILGALNIGDTIFYKGQYYRMQVRNAMREIEFPGGTSYVMGTFNTNWTPVAGPSWNGYAAPTTPGMANPAGTTTTGTVGATAGAAATPGSPSATTSWTLLLPGHPTDNILRALEYDPSKPNSMAWEDNRDEMETVNAEADLYNPAVLPPSHLTVGKLVYVRATGQLWECIVDGTTGTITNTIADWKPLGGAGVTYVGRIGNLPDPTVKTVPDGSLFMVNMDLVGNPYHRLYVFDAQGTNAAGVVGVYRPCATKDFIKALRSDADQGLDAEVGDLQVTLENGHKELKAQDAAGAWQTVYSEDLVKQWIAAGNLFQGTTQDRGHGTVGAVDLNALPAQSALGITDAGHYYIYVGLAGHVIAANEIGGAASNIDGAKLNVGDWILVANTGTAAAPVMRYTHVPGDLLAKSRGDNLYGLNNWTAGAYEQGSLVVYNGDVYKAAQAVLATDIAPGVTPTTPGVTNPWAKVNISGGVKTVATDADLPAGAANGAVFLVLSSARAGGKQSLYSWDAGASAWNPLGGGGIPLQLGGGKKLQNVGVPIGTILMFGGATAPAGYKLCDGSTFDQTVYPELYAVLGVNRVPDFHDMFPRGWSGTRDNAWTRHTATTGMPTTHFTGVTNSTGSHTHTTDSQGEHRHNVGFSMSNHNWKGGGSWTGDATCNFSQDGGAASSSAGGHTHTTTSAGAHTHTVEINSGGDAETAPVHVRVPFIIKCDDIDIRKHA